MRNEHPYVLHPEGTPSHAAPTDHHRIRWFGHQLVGTRDDQQDAFSFGPGFGVVADGVGGKRGGGEAARLAVSIHYPADGDPESYMERLTRQLGSQKGSTTLVWARATRDYLEIGSCGDSGAAWYTREGYRWLTPASPSPRSNLLLTALGRSEVPEFTLSRYVWPTSPGLLLLYTDGLDPVLDRRAEIRRRNISEEYNAKLEGAPPILLREEQLDREVFAALAAAFPQPDRDPTPGLQTFATWAVERAAAQPRADNSTLLVGAFTPPGRPTAKPR